MDTYEQKYKDLIARLQKAKENDDVCDERYCCVIDEIVPELKESEDEKVRKVIIELVRQSSEILGMQNQSNILAWLEKQGNPTDKDMKEALRTEFEKGRADAFAQMQKEWSEEDEVRLQACLDTLQAKSLMGKVDTIMTEWLKSLKDRVQPIHEYSDTERQEMFIKSQRPHFWKPTDKQMDTLLSEVTGWTKGCPKQKVLESLYNDLKKLREGEL